MEHPNGRARRIPTLARSALFASLTLGALLTAPVEAASWRVIVRGHGPSRGEIPLFTKVEAEVPPGDYLLTPEKGGKALPAHIFKIARQP